MKGRRLRIVAPMLLVATSLQASPPDGGGAAPMPTDRIDERERQRIWQEVLASRQKLVLQGLLPADPASAKGRPPKYRWPVIGVTDDPGVDAISNFVDLDPAFPDMLLDYNCGARSYDLPSGYNHQGVDVFTWPFGWLKMDFDEVEVRAAAGGRLIFKSDGNFDRSCSFGGGPWNAVYVEHSDGSITWYGHLKDGSVTTVPVGGRVLAGDYLGVVGSSGSSTGPHLHLETYDGDGQLVEPFAGACNGLNAQSWWENQPPYRDSRINLVATHDAAPDLRTCPEQEMPNYQDRFEFGEVVYFATYYRDQLATQTTTHAVLRPDGTTFDTWQHTPPQDNSASYWFWTRALPVPAMPGVWTFRVEFEDQVEETTFEVGIFLFESSFEDDENP